MRLILLVALVTIPALSKCQESSWSWNENKNEEEDLKASGSEIVEQQLNSTQIEEVVDDILVSNRQGRNIDGFDEVYSDPNVQDALQNGDDGEARNLIKERLCNLGLMKVSTGNDHK